MESEESEHLRAQPSGKDLDSVLCELGNPGKFHILLYSLILLSNCYVGIHHVALVSTYGITPSHWCQQSIQVSTGANNTTVGNWSIGREKCSVVVYENATQKTKLMEEKCHGDWRYSSKIKTIATEWNLVCDLKYLPSLANVIYFIGVMFGGFFCGFASDRIGRRPVMLVCMGVSAVTSFATCFMPLFPLFAVCRLIQGFFNAGLHGIVYIIPGETSALKHMHYISVLLINAFITSVSFGLLIAWSLRNWRYVQFLLTLPTLILFPLTYRYVPESLRWLAVHGKEAELVQALTKMSKFNGSKVDGLNEVAATACQKAAGNKASKYGLRDIFQNKEIRKRSILMFYLWLVAAITYYGLSIELSTLTSDPYLTVLIGSICDIPAFVLSFWYMRFFGKRRPAAVLLSVGGLVCLSYVIYPSVVLVIISKGLLAVCFGILFLYVPELYPTVIRNLGVGTCTLFSRIGSVLAPQIVLLGLYTTSHVPLIVFGVLAFIAGILTTFLPETHKRALPDTFLDIELKS